MFVTLSGACLTSSWRYLPAFTVAALQARRANGNLAVSLLREADNTFWTRSLWTDEAAMKSFMVSDAHRSIVPKLLEWCDEASVARWTQALLRSQHGKRHISGCSVTVEHQG
jgi:quinol monooxygenase YgiN